MQVSSRLQGSLSLGASLGVVSVLALALFATLAPAAMAAPATASYVVVLNDDVAHPAYLAHRHERNRGAEITHVYGVAIKGYSAMLTRNELKAIEKDPNVDYVESDGVVEPYGQAVGNQLKRVYANLSNLKINENDVPADRVNADIAILDTGVYQHPDLNIVARVNCVGGGGGCKPGQFDDDAYGHGTHVAGDAAAIDNGFGAVGTAPGARIWSVKVIKRIGYIGTDEVGMSLGGIVPKEDGGTITNLADGNNRMSDAIAGIDYVTAHSSEIEVANMSFACATDEWGCARTALAEAIASSVNSGVVWVAAAGQEGMGVANNFAKIRHYPALLSDVITVSAMADYDGLPGSLSNADACPLEKGFQHDDRLMVAGKPASPTGIVTGGLGSNYGPEVDMTAPGSCVFSTWSPINPGSTNAYGIPGGSEYGFMYGSSVASALVAGAAADIAAGFNPNSRADVEKIKSALTSAGNYNWEDLAPVGDGGAYVSPDGVKEPLLDMSKIGMPPKGPIATTNPAVQIGATTARLNAWVTASGAATNYYFQYGKTTAYGSTYPVPAGSAGSGSSPISVWNDVSGLTPLTIYHYRVVATNSAGTSYGADQTFTTLSGPNGVFYVDAAKGKTITDWYWESTSGWHQQPFYGDEVAAGTSPSALMINGSPHVFYVNATKGNALTEWYWEPTVGWQQKVLGEKVAAGTSPSAVMVNGTPEVFFVDANRGNTISCWYREGATWKFQPLFGDKVASGSSPSVTLVNGTPQVFFVDAAKGNTIATWYWEPSTGWHQQPFYGDSVASGTSPSAVTINGTARAFFVDAAKGNTIAQWYWDPAGWHQHPFYGDNVAAGTSPSATVVNNTAQVFFVDAAKGNTIANWRWESSPGWQQQWLYGDSVAAGTSPSAVTINGTGQAFFVDAAKGNTIARWYWEPSGWQLQPFYGDSVAAGTSPSVVWW